MLNTIQTLGALARIKASGGGGIGGNDANTVLLLNMEGADGGTTFTDTSVGGSTHTLTPSNITTSTAQAKFGNTSALCSVNGTLIETTPHVDYGFGTGDFTVDGWIYPTSLATYDMIYANTSLIYWALLADGHLQFYDGVGPHNTAAGVVTVNNWQHIALVRASGVLKMFANGVVKYSAAMSRDLGATQPLYLFRYTSNTHFFNGYVDEFRISKGIARWTSDFIPPVGPYST